MDCHALPCGKSRNDDKKADSSQSSLRSPLGLKQSIRPARKKWILGAKSLLEKHDSKHCGGIAKVDSRNEAQSLNDSQAAGFADDFVGCQGVGEGIYLSGNEQAHAADSRKSAAKPTP